MLSLNTIRRHVRQVARSNGAQRAVLFGSFARGTASAHSDVDLFFVEATDQPFLKRLGRYLDPLSDRLKAGVEILVYTPDEFTRMRDKPFIRRALQEGIVLYESRETPG
jgi:uncharacterized protein